MTVEEEKLERAIRLDEESLVQLESGCLEGAERACRAALELFQELDGPRHPDGANLLQRLSSILQARSCYREAETCAARAVAIMDEVAATVESRDIAVIHIESLRQWASAQRQLARYEEAESLARRAVEMAAADRDRALLIGALNELGVLCKYSGQFEEGRHVYLRALGLAIALYGELHPSVATIYHNLGGLEHARGDFAAGEPPARHACEIRRQLVGPDHPDTLADECAWAGLLDGLERYPESRPIYERALRIFERHYGPDHFEMAATLHNLAAVDAAEGDREVAAARAARALSIKEKLFGRDHPESLGTAALLAAILQACGNRCPPLP